MFDATQVTLVGLGAVAAGAINALAGGGTLISFPILVAVGVPPIAASVTSTVALCPGYLGATLAQWSDLADQRARMWRATPAGIAGGVVGGLLLLRTGDRLFRDLVPYLILLAALLLAIQDPVRRRLQRRAEGDAGHRRRVEGLVVVPIGVAAIYGGYFGAGMSVILLAVLGLLLDDSLTRLNALKQFLALVINTAAAVFFLFSGRVVWSLTLVMAVGALVGGALGGRLAGRVPPAILRGIVVLVGVVVGLVYLFRR